jgi:aspartyl-tRNA(Asn)/glutamyl-tRNA(Gln) amidotransferase subunit C
MKVNREIVDRLAQLSRLEFSEQEKVEIERDLEKILSFMEQLNEINTDGIEPLVYVNEMENIFREDVVVQTIEKSELLKNAPLPDENFFKVPKVIQQ